MTPEDLGLIYKKKKGENDYYVIVYPLVNRLLRKADPSMNNGATLKKHFPTNPSEIDRLPKSFFSVEEPDVNAICEANPVIDPVGYKNHTMNKDTYEQHNTVLVISVSDYNAIMQHLILSGEDSNLYRPVKKFMDTMEKSITTTSPLKNIVVKERWAEWWSYSPSQTREAIRQIPIPSKKRKSTDTSPVTSSPKKLTIKKLGHKKPEEEEEEPIPM